MYHRIKKSVYLTVSLTPRLERRLNLPDSGTATEVKLDRPWQVIVLTAPVSLTRISHRFLLNGYKCMYERGLCNLARNRSSFGGCSAETSKRQAREAVLSLRSAWSRARARSRRGSRSALPRIASRICETSGLMSYVVMVFHLESLDTVRKGRASTCSLCRATCIWSYAWYLFLAGLQSLLVREIDPSCEEAVDNLTSCPIGGSLCAKHQKCALIRDILLNRELDLSGWLSGRRGRPFQRAYPPLPESGKRALTPFGISG